MGELVTEMGEFYNIRNVLVFVNLKHSSMC